MYQVTSARQNLKIFAEIWTQQNSISYKENKPNLNPNAKNKKTKKTNKQRNKKTTKNPKKPKKTTKKTPQKQKQNQKEQKKQKTKKKTNPKKPQKTKTQKQKTKKQKNKLNPYSSWLYAKVHGFYGLNFRHICTLTVERYIQCMWQTDQLVRGQIQ